MMVAPLNNQFRNNHTKFHACMLKCMTSPIYMHQFAKRFSETLTAEILNWINRKEETGDKMRNKTEEK